MLDYENTLNTYEAKSYEIAEAKLDYLDKSIAKVTEETEKLTKLTEDSMKVLEFQFKHLGESNSIDTRSISTFIGFDTSYSYKHIAFIFDYWN